MRESLHLSSLRQVFFLSNSLSHSQVLPARHSFILRDAAAARRVCLPPGWFIDQPNNSTMSFFRPRHKRNQEEMEWNEKEMRREEKRSSSCNEGKTLLFSSRWSWHDSHGSRQDVDDNDKDDKNTSTEENRQENQKEEEEEDTQKHDPSNYSSSSSRYARVGK